MTKKSDVVAIKDAEKAEILNKGRGQKYKSDIIMPPRTLADRYAKLLFWALIPMSLFVWLFLTLGALPLAMFWQLYVRLCVERPTDRETSWAFVFMCVITAPYAAFLYAFASFWWWAVFFVVMFASLPVALLRIVFLCEGGKIINNFRLIAPFSAFNHFSYMMVARAYLGQMDRQGLWEFFFGKWFQGSFAITASVVPLFKYCYSTNPLLFTLSEVRINQWTPPFESMPKDEVIHNLRQLVSREIHDLDSRGRIDKGLFAACYPYGRSLGKEPDSVIGIQYTERSKIVMFTKTIFSTPDYHTPYHAPGKNCRSETGATGIYDVRLHFFSFHVLTGYVEVNYTPDKRIEHPMFIITAADSLEAMTIYQSVNDLFGYYMPEVMDFIFKYDDETPMMSSWGCGLC